MRTQRWRLSAIATGLLLVLSVLLPVLVVLRLNAANKPTGRGPVGPDEAGADWDPHGYTTIVAVMFAVPVVAAAALAFGRILARRRPGQAAILVTTVLAGLYLLAFGSHVPGWLVVLAGLVTAGAAALSVSELAARQRQLDRPH